MRIEKALAIPARGGFFNDDLAAIRAGARRDGFAYKGKPLTPGFSQIRQPSEAVSIVLVLDNGQTVVGDAISVEYSGAGGRRGRFRQEEQLPYLARVCQHLEGQYVTDFLCMCEALEREEFDEGLHRPAALYAVSQVLLQAVAMERRRTCAEVLAEELGVAVSQRIIPIYVQCGDERHDNVDKAILKQADVLPHGLINDIDSRLGRRGELLAEYVSWIVSRIEKYGRNGYQPEIHIDVYGLLGQIFDYQVEPMASYVADLGERAKPYQFCLETPVLMESRQAQMDLFGALRGALAKLGSPVQLIVDEWANDLDDILAFIRAGVTDMINVKTPDLGTISKAAKAVLQCWAGGVRPILGGSCTDTDQSARVISHVALATRPAWVLARPGMGIDEGLQIVYNEMARTLAIIQARNGCPSRTSPLDFRCL